MDEYVREFVQESEENITELNNALLALERAPDDDEAMEQIFRTAHTLKGNCGAMGFTDASDLAHALEDLLDAVRSGQLEVSPELMDRIFEGVDELEAMIDEVPENGEPRTDPTETIDRLRAELAATEGLIEPSDREIDELVETAGAPADGSHNLFHVRLGVSEELESQGMLVVEALEDAFDLLGTAPEAEEIADGDYGGSFDAVFASAVQENSISAALDPVDAVEDAIIAEVTDRLDREDATADEPADAAVEEPAADVDPDDMEVDDLLDEFSEYDDLDEMVEQVDDVEGFDDLGDAGTFDDVEVGDVDVDAPSPDEVDAGDADDAEASADDADAEPADADAGDGDASDTFQELKQEVDPVGFDELQDELAELEFEELDDDEVGFDELLDEDELGGDDPFATGEVSEDPFGAGDADEPSVGELIGEDEPADEGDPTDEPSVDELVEGVDDAGSDAGVEDDPADEPVAAEPSADVDDDPTADDASAATADEQAADDASAATADEPVSGDEPVSVDEPASAEADDATASDADETDIGDALDGALDDSPAEEDATETSDEGATDDDLDDISFGESATVDDADEGPELELDDPFDGNAGSSAEESDGDGSEGVGADADGAAESGDADDEGVELSSAGQFEDIDFSDPDGPDEDEEFGTADELDLSMGLDDTEDEADDGGADDTSVETTTFGADAATPDDGADADEADAADDAAVDAESAGAVDAGAEDGDLADAGVSDAEPADAETDAADAVASTDTEADTADATDATGGSAASSPTTDEADTESAPSAAAGTGVSADEIQSIRVDVDQVDDLMNLVEELVTTRARLRRAVEADEPRTVIEGEVDELETITSEMQDTVMDVRLVPLKTVANKLPRLVRDLSRDQDKQVALEMDGEDVELDRSILNDIGDPLMHLVRNAIDHGIEPPAEREAAGKDPEGTIELRARRERDEVVIEIEDDGRGLDVDAIRDEAAEEGIAEYEELLEMDDEEVYDLVFHSGFSTSEEVTDVSGRGVGMDVVARTVEDLDGSVSVDSDVGEGTTVSLRVPISVAIADVLFVESGGEEYGIPIKVVEDIGPSGTVSTEDGREVIARGEESYPLIRLADALETPETGRNGDGMTVKVRDDVRPVALHCDQIRGQQEVVVKPFEGFLGDIPGLSGATVLGEGDVVNILDVETL
ncbi:Hpt domain-containing protein [Natronoarchaeum rubrum]|uniref:Hpt domain-containing protein n=1 Tax=Natronoarchaeum rubrum TaxID=755311 RepID=UPI00211127A1|nr:Hpt domain-containing protein [Natronoarchaeum rubrum]